MVQLFGFVQVYIN